MPLDRNRTDWFKQLGWGLFTHYLTDEDVNAEEWNERIDAFDVNGLADQLEFMGVKYFFITLGQNSGHYCSPNATYDRYVGISPSKCSTRDLINDLYEVLQPKGIRLLVYLPSGAPDRDQIACKALDWENGKYVDYKKPFEQLDELQRPWGAGNSRLIPFQKKWEDIIKEWSFRWENKISGWWFDGCYFADAMYRHRDSPNFASLAAAARSGNPNSILAFNPGVLPWVPSITEHEDYTAGEISTKFPQCPGRWVNNAQFHILTYLGESWGSGIPRFSDQWLVEYTRNIIQNEGVITYDVPIETNGLIPQVYIDQVKALSVALGGEA